MKVLDDLYPLIAIMALSFAALVCIDPDGSIWRAQKAKVAAQAATIKHLEDILIACGGYGVAWQLGPTRIVQCFPTEIAD